MKRRLLLPVFLAASALGAQGTNSAAQGGSSDYLARLLQQGHLGWGMLAAAMVAAFGLGAVHALSPGHGKTIVAAYLVGSRSTAKHAVLLGLVVTFTHTISVFVLGFVTLFLSRYVLPEKIYPMLGTISGLSIVWVGGTLFYWRLRAVRRRRQHHRPHSHLPEGDVSLAGLMALGASGGLVPCPSALVLLLSSVALGRVALGLTLLVAFSTGLAVVLMAIGVAAVYAKHLLPDSEKTARSAVLRYLPVASAAVITCVGAVMTAVALGVVRVAI
jgi:nickel/cobalt transporter (NicO) family protein